MVSRQKDEVNYNNLSDDENLTENELASLEENYIDIEDEDDYEQLSVERAKKPRRKKAEAKKRKGRKSKKKAQKRNIYIMFGLIFLLALIVIYFVFIRGAYGKLEPAQEGIEAGSKLKDYVSLVKFKNDKDEERYKIEYRGSKIVLDEVGSYPVQYLLTNKKDGQIIEEEVKIKVLDTTPPKILSDSVVMDKGNKFDTREMIKVKDNAKGDIAVSVESGEYNTEEIGSYNVVIKAEDESGNVGTKNVKLFVKMGQSQFFNNLGVSGGAWIEETYSGLRKHYFYERTGDRFYKVEGANALQIKISSMDVDISGNSAVIYGKDLSYPDDSGKVNIKLEIRNPGKEIVVMMYDAARGGYGERITLEYWDNNKINEYEK